MIRSAIPLTRPGMGLLAVFTAIGLVGAAPAWAARTPNSVTVGAGTCWGGSVSFPISVGSTGAGTGTGTLTGPTGLPTGVTAAYTHTAINFTNAAPTDTATVVLTIGPTAAAGTTPFTVTCSPVSGNGSLVIAAAAGISVQPQPVTVCVGNTANFSVTASGSGLTYQWRKGGSNIGGATSSSYTTPVTVLGDNGAIYDVVIKSSCAAQRTSNGATLTVTPNNTIAASAGTGGSISPSGSVAVSCAGSQSFTISADACHDLADVVVDGVSKGAITSYSFTNVLAGHTITASFTQKTNTINASAGANGSITPSGATVVNCGAGQSFTIAAASCYDIADVVVDGVSRGAVTSYAFANVTANHTIAASFALKTYTINASAGANGGITPSGATGVNCGAGQGYAIAPNPCYNIADVLVDGVSRGAVASYAFSNVTANHTIAASFSLRTYAIDASAGAGGGITPSGVATLGCGNDATYTIAANACYHIADVTVDGGSVGAVSSYAFTNVTANHTVSATFAIDTHTIDASAGANGSITPSGQTGLDCGDGQNYTITPDACHHIADVLVDGVSVGTVPFYSFANVQANHTISASFAIDQYTIAATASLGGSISPTGIVVVDCGGDQSFTIAPDACHHLVDVTVDGGSVGAVTSYAFTNVQAPHAIAATFAIDTNTIDANAGSNGSVSPAGANGVDCGTNLSVTITPDACYHVADVEVDGGSVGAVTNWDFTNVQANHTLNATFSIDTYSIEAGAGAGGSITPSGTASLDCGDDPSYAIAADPCYHVVDVTVDGGSVGAVTSYDFTNVQANHTIDATFAIDTYTIDASGGAGGSVSPNGSTVVNCGGDQSVTIDADACWHVVDVEVDGGSVGAVTNWDFTNVQANHTISATFAIDTYTIDASAGAGGSVSPNGSTVVNCGDDQSVAITPDPAYHVVDVEVDGGSVGPVTNWDFDEVQANHTVSATFAIDTYTVDASAGPGGGISASGTTVLDSGDDLSLTITPDACYHVDDVLVDGGSVGAVTSYAFTNVVANHTISATFAIDTYTIDASAGSGGRVSPDGTTVLNCGGDQSVTITPDACWHVVDVEVDGGSVGAVTNWDFTNVQANHTLSATFAIDTYTIDASAGAGGSVSPSGATVVNCGDDQSVAITPDPAYHVVDVEVDGGSVGPVTNWDFDEVQANHTMSATFAIDMYSVDASAGPGGSISPSGTTGLDSGDDLSLTIAPDACYHVVDVLVDGGSVGAVTSYGFVNVLASHTISATFAIDTYTIDASAGSGGSVSPDGATVVNCGGDHSVTITPEACWHVVDVEVDGGSVGAVTNWDFTNVQANHTISATFAMTGYAIDAAATPGGSINPAGNLDLDCGDSQVFTMTADACHHLVDVEVDGGSVGAVTSYTFTNLQADHAIAATFAIDTYTLDASATAGGSVSPIGSTVVNCGDDQSVTIAAAACHHLVDVEVDGSSVGAVTNWDFMNMQANHTIAATFAIDTYAVFASGGLGGSVSPSGMTGLDCGDGLSVTITPGACWRVADVEVDGGSVGAVTQWDFTNVQANHTLSATFVMAGYSIDAGATGGGSITPSGTASLNCGDDQGYVIAADACHHLVDVTVDGGSVGAVTSYDFTNVQADHTIRATFAADEFALEIASDGNGTVSPAGTTMVACGGSQTVTFTPDACYHVQNIYVDESPVGPTASYTFTNVAAAHLLTVEFALDTNAAQIITGANGSIAGPANIDCGDSQTYTITPDNGYLIWDVAIDGASMGVLTSYTFTNVHEPHSIEAVFLDITVPTVITNLDAQAFEDGVRIVWQIDHPSLLTDVSLERAAAAVGPWTAVSGEVSRTVKAAAIVDRSVTGGTTYWYRLVGTTTGGQRVTYGPVQAQAVVAVRSFALSRVTPNPTPGAFSVDFTLVREARVHLGLHDLQGREVAVLGDGVYRAGRYQARWDGMGDHGTVPAGVYFVRYSVAGQHFTQRVVITR